jgi:xylan 1,4-beta-xylosidase
LGFDHVPANAPVTLSVVDDNHGNALAAYRAIGSPQYPTEEQIRKINAATTLPPPDRLHLDGTHLDLELQVNALALVEIHAAK